MIEETKIKTKTKRKKCTFPYNPEQLTTRMAKRHGWTATPIEKFSKKASRYMYEVRFWDRTIRDNEGRVDLSELMEHISCSPGCKIKMEGVGLRHRITVWLKTESDLILLKLANLGVVFMVYRLLPRNG